MATITVTTLADTVASDGQVSLREALQAANADTSVDGSTAGSGDDTIIFDPILFPAGGTLFLANGAGDLHIATTLTIDGDINGDGLADIAISADSAEGADDATSRVFNVDGGAAAPITASLNGLVIRDGSDVSAGAIWVHDDVLIVTNSTITANNASNGPGAVLNFGATTLINTVVSDNDAGSSSGGAIHNLGTLDVVNSMLSGNRAGYNAGAISNYHGAVRISNSTLSGNYAGYVGGAIHNKVGTVTLTNTTIVGNEADFGGGIFNSDGAVTGTVTLINSTVSGNLATTSGGGIHNHGPSGAVLVLTNTIVAGNEAVTGDDLRNVGTLILDGGNIVGDTFTVDGGSPQTGIALEDIFAAVDDNPDTGVSSGVLAFNGGPVQTIAIKQGGAAQDAADAGALPADAHDLDGDADTAETLPVDARGYARVVGASLDIGAFEQQAAQSFEVTTLEDQLDSADPDATLADFGGLNDLSLREALVLANQDPTTADTITFASSLIGGTAVGVDDGTLLLVQGELLIDSDVTIDGDIGTNGTRDIMIDAQGSSRVIMIGGGTAALNGLRITGGSDLGGLIGGGGVSIAAFGPTPADVLISNSIITGNEADVGGGIAVLPFSSLRLVNSEVSGNGAYYFGSGIANAGTLTMVNSTLADNNRAVGGYGIYGGGLYNGGPFATATIIDSTISGHGSGSDGIEAGGGIYNNADLTLINSTISDNAAYTGGGILNGGRMTIVNATVANNLAVYGGGLYNSDCGCGDVTVVNSTFSGNFAEFGGGLYNAAGTVELANSIVAGNGAYGGADILTAATPAATTIYSGTNLFAQIGAGDGDDLDGVDIAQVFATLTTIVPPSGPGDAFQAGVLADNGGPVRTIALKAGDSNPALDAGDATQLDEAVLGVDLNGDGDTGDTIATDARGSVRVQGSTVDIGAFELQPPTIVPFDDHNADGTGDILWRHDSGYVALWEMQDGAIAVERGVDGRPGSIQFFPDVWDIVGKGDFNGEGTTDILWRNTDNGYVVSWEMLDGGLWIERGVGLRGLEFHIEETGDFNGDGTVDVLWRHDDGFVSIWDMANGQLALEHDVVGGGLDLTWNVVETGDFNGDGTSDILWRQDGGALALWEMQNGTLAVERGVASLDSTWTVVEAGDFNGDRTSDVLWRHDTGAVTLFEMQDGAVAASRALGGFDTTWEIAAANDVTGDGTTDVIWRNEDTGYVATWEMQNGQVAVERGVGLFDNTWTLV